MLYKNVFKKINYNLYIMSGKIKQIADELAKLTVAEVRELQVCLEEEYDIKPCAFTAVGNVDNSASAPSAAEEKSIFTVILKSAGAAKINVIRAVKEITGLGLGDAKALVDSAPKEVKVDVPKNEANSIKEKLEAAGAEVELK